MINTTILTIDEVKDAVKEYVIKKGVKVKAGDIIEPVLNEKDDSFNGFKIISEVDTKNSFEPGFFTR